MDRLTGARAIVTGGGRGVGRATAIALAREGASVVVCARSGPQIDDTVHQIRAAGGKATAVTADVTSSEQVAELARVAADTYGGVDILVNNAGNYIARLFSDYEIEDWRSLFEVNVLAVVRVTQAVLPMMVSRRAGRIINVASTAAKWGAIGQSAYNASKHALLGLTQSLALETASQGIRVNAVCPTWVDTELIDDKALAPIYGVPVSDLRATLASKIPIGRLMTANDVAEAVVYLSLPASDAITGIGLTLAGGQMLI